MEILSVQVTIEGVATVRVQLDEITRIFICVNWRKLFK